MEERLHFEAVARLYEAARPGYPELLFDDLRNLARVPEGGSILDIGCGTGKSTEPPARRGFKVCALDPGANMLAVCREKLSRYPDVRYVQAAFEQWRGDGSLFDLAVSGTAFHWVGEAGCERLAGLLKRQGAVSIFWHTYLSGRDPLHDRLDRVYRDHAPGLWVPDLRAAQELADRRKEERLLAWDGFGDRRVIRCYDRLSCDARGYVDLQRTWSTHANLGEAFFAAVASAIDEAGGRIAKPIRTTLCLGRRSG